MKSIIVSILSLSLLTLLPSCGSRKFEHDPQSLNPDKLEQLIRESARPYVVVNLYATYCKPCIKEIPELIKLKTDLNSDAEVLFISVDDEKTIKSGLAGFLHDHQMDFQTYYYPQDSVSKYVRAMIPNWNRQIPLNMVFTQNGHLIEHTGMTDKDEIEMIINQHKDFHN